MATRPHKASRAATTPASVLKQLSTRLEHKLGRSAFRSVLESIDRQTTAYGTITHGVDSDLRSLRAATAARTATLRELVIRDAFSSDEVQKYIPRSRPIINKMAKDGTLLAITDGRRLRFPKWQFDETTEDGLVRGLRNVLSVMDATPFRKAAWFITENRALSKRTPLDVLRDGDVLSVIEEAKSLISF